MNLAEMVKEGRFREDLYYRINTVTLHLPPLRERTDEIASLSMLFVKNFAEKYHRQAKNISDDALELLQNCQWKGNIRELQSRIEKAVIMSDNEILLPSDFQIADNELLSVTNLRQNVSLEDAEEQVIRDAMKKYNGNLSLVAKALKISRPTLYNRLKKYGI